MRFFKYFREIFVFNVGMYRTKKIHFCPKIELFMSQIESLLLPFSSKRPDPQ